MNDLKGLICRQIRLPANKTFEVRPEDLPKDGLVKDEGGEGYYFQSKATLSINVRMAFTGIPLTDPSSGITSLGSCLRLLHVAVVL
jgi:hypothetical protein